MHLFSSDPFLTSVAEAYFGGRPHRIAPYRAAGRLVRLLAVDGAPPVTSCPFYDFVPTLDLAEVPDAAELRYVPRAAVEVVETGARPPLTPDQQPSPFVAWSSFRSWDAFEAHVAARSASLASDSRRQRRKLEREVGPLRFELDDARPEVLARCLEWKSAQYIASGYPDLFRRPENVELFARLRANGALLVSALWAGDTLVAAHLGGCDPVRLSSWIPAYDPAYARYSPGRLLLESLLRASCARGDEEFDFLIGDEAYKQTYATHERIVGPLGSPPPALRLARAAHAGIRRTLRAVPAIDATVRRLRRMWMA